MCDYLTSDYKEYIAEVTLGIKTDTLDITGNILRQNIKAGTPLGILAKSIIDKGVFSTALYDLKSANKAGKTSTGNGFRSGSAVSEMPTNLIVEPGEKSFEELLEEVGEGIILTDLSGLHAGVNPISGDFSLLCEGYLIENGKKGRPVEQITVAGNFYEVIKSIKSVGNDIINLPSGEGEFFTPSVYIESLAISGDEE